MPGFRERRKLGPVNESFTDPAEIARLSGFAAIGHNRYSTSGGKTDDVERLRNIQPLTAKLPGGGIAIAHNGNLTQFDGLAGELRTRGYLFKTETDTEIIAGYNNNQDSGIFLG